MNYDKFIYFIYQTLPIILFPSGERTTKKSNKLKICISDFLLKEFKPSLFKIISYGIFFIVFKPDILF